MRIGVHFDPYPLPYFLNQVITNGSEARNHGYSGKVINSTQKVDALLTLRQINKVPLPLTGREMEEGKRFESQVKLLNKDAKQRREAKPSKHYGSS